MRFPIVVVLIQMLLYYNNVLCQGNNCFLKTDTLNYYRSDGPYGKTEVYFSKAKIGNITYLKYGFQYYGGYSIKYGLFQLKRDSLFIQNNCLVDSSFTFVGVVSMRKKSSLRLPLQICSPLIISNIFYKSDFIKDSFSRKIYYRLWLENSAAISNSQMVTYLILDKDASIIEYGFYDGNYNLSYRIKHEEFNYKIKTSR